MTAAEIIAQAAHTRLAFNDVLSFNYVNAVGVEWEGCIEEWIGNSDHVAAASDLAVEMGGSRYFQIGSSGGGADLLLVKDANPASIWYYNDYDMSIAEVTPELDNFLSRLHEPS